MVAYQWLKYLVTISIFYLICTKNLLLASSYSPRNRFQVERTSSYSPLRIEGKGPGQYTRINADFSPPISNLTQKLLMKDAKPGFDFNDQEIMKLKIWEHGVIPYYIDDLSFDKVLRDKIRLFLDMTNSVAGLRFMELPRPPTDETTRWVFFINRRGLLACADHPIKNFTNQGVQKFILGYDCLSGKEMAEAVLALVGVPPQHNAPDRDDYIEVYMENIQPEKKYLFDKLQNDEWLFHEVPYDFNSASHYDLHKYTINGAATIIPKKLVDDTVGQTDGFSSNDIKKIRLLYNFISKKKSNNIKVPDCQKLFEPGSNFSNFQPEPIDVVRPRKKPNKYLGLPDSGPQQSDDDVQDEVMKHTQEIGYQVQLSAGNGNVEEEANKENQSIDDSVEIPVSNNNNKNERSVLKKYIDKDRLKDPLADLSDYQTEEELKKRTKRVLLKFTKMSK